MKRPLKLNVRQDSWLHLNTTTIMLLLLVFYLLTFYRINVSDGFLYNVFQALNAKIDLAGVVYCLVALLIIRDVF